MSSYFFFLRQDVRGRVRINDTATWKLNQTLDHTGYVISIDIVPHMILNYSYVEFSLTMTRLPQYYLYTVGLPSTAVTILALFTFWLPDDSGEKLSFVVSLMLGLTVFQLVIADTLPETSGNRQPLMSTYLLFNLIMVAVILMLTLVSITVHSSRRKITSRRLRKFLFEVLPSLFCVHTGHSIDNDEVIEYGMHLPKLDQNDAKESNSKPQFDKNDRNDGKSSDTMKRSRKLSETAATNQVCISQNNDKLVGIASSACLVVTNVDYMSPGPHGRTEIYLY